jgi:hypothetical protein
MADSYPLPFGKIHRAIEDGFSYAIRSGGGFAVAAPRGSGKSTELWGLALYALLTGKLRFPVYLPWAARDYKKALRFWKNALCHNSLLLRDYPQACAPFAWAKGNAMKLLYATNADGEPCGAQLRVSEGMIVLPDSLGIIGSATINGNPRGLNHSSENGEVWRPDFALIDDPQDRETAQSATLTADVVHTIDADVAGMSGPDRPLPMCMACTVVADGDVASHYLGGGSGWHSVRIGQVETWPNGWDIKDSEARRLWSQWDEIRREGEDTRDAGEAAIAFYLAHREQMTAGMAVSWDDRYDRKLGHPDALYTAMHDLHKMGEEAFASERQNAPLKQGATVYTLTPEIVQSRVDFALLAGKVPDWATAVVATTDVNPSYALSTVVVAFGQNQRAHVMAYWQHPMSLSQSDAPAVISRGAQVGLSEVGSRIAKMDPTPRVWLIDGGGTPQDTVIGFCGVSQKACGMQGLTAFGRAARQYRPTARYKVLIRQECHEVIESMARRWAIFNADFWRELSQVAWVQAPGLPGSCSLPAGNHRDFADQLCREPLKWKAETPAGMRWEYGSAPGPHDYGDCMTMSYVAAALLGIDTGQVAKPERKPARIPIFRPSQGLRRR